MAIPLILIRMGSGPVTTPQVGKATIGDAAASGATIGDVGLAATIGDVAAGTATIGDDP
jgi:hypothetical protein